MGAGARSRFRDMFCSTLLIVLLTHETSATQSVNPKETLRRKPPIEWSILDDARPAPGTAVGTYAGNEFPKEIRLAEYRDSVMPGAGTKR
jgi:hypothetical protein